MTKLKRALSFLLAAVMIATLLLVPVSADGESGSGESYQGMEVVYAGGETPGTSGLVMSKTLMPYTDGQHQLRLELYTTGEKVTSTIQVDAPTDIVLVLDQSGSMADKITTTTTTYAACTDYKNSSLYGKKDDLYVKVGDEYKQVTVTENETIVSSTTSYEYAEVSSNSEAYENRGYLYTIVGREYVKVEVERSGLLSYTYTYTYTGANGETATDTGSSYDYGILGKEDKLPNIDLFIRSENTVTEYAYSYTYTYTGADGKNVTLATIEGKDGTYAAGEGTGTDGKLYSKSETSNGETTRLAALKDAVEKFADAVAVKAAGPDGDITTTDDNVDHRIAVVGFASDTSKYYNTELLTGVTITTETENYGTEPVSNNSYHYYYPTGYAKNGAQYGSITTAQYQNAFQDMSTTAGQDNVQTAFDALTARGGTQTDHGLDMANQIFANNPIPEGETRNRVVIVFTDGIPTANGSNYDGTCASNAITNAGTAKNTYGATVYTVGIFTGADENSAGSTGNNSSDADKGNYVCQQISSNNGNVPTGTAKKHYFAANNTAALNNIFEQISQNVESSTTTTELGSETVVRDIVSSSFQLPEGATKDDITIETYSCTGVDASGNYTWSKNNSTMGATASIGGTDGKTVDVTGFDFKANYVYATNGSNARGDKLVITIPIQDNGEGMGQVSTNGDKSGVYESSSSDAKCVALFEQPLVNFPYFQVGHIESKVDTTGEKTGTAGKNYGEQNGELVKYRVYENTPFDLVDKVTEGYLYGGAFSTADCDAENVQTFATGENALSYTPAAGEVYYIWEVPNHYLPANVYNVWKTNGDGLTRLYMLTAADRELYQKVGFDVTGYESEYISGQDGSQITNPDAGMLYGLVEVEKMGSGYQTVYLNNGKMKETAQNTTLAADAYHDEGFIGGYRMTSGMFNTVRTGGSVTFQSYWVTLDGIKVYGLKQAALTYTEGNTKATVTRTEKAIDPAYVGVETDGGQGIMLMSFAEVYAIGDSAEPTVTITVHDNGSVYTQGVDEVLHYAGAEGQVFAGWFLDEDCTTPVDFGSITESTDMYAKYVSDAYLQVKYNKLGLFRVSGVSLVSAVDDVDGYAETGILVNGEKVSVSYSKRYMLLFTAASLFDGASRDAQLMTAQLSLSGSGSLEVTPYWVTLDGTTVYGQSRTLSYTARSIQG